MTTRGYTVHEFAALAGVTVKALHHYDRIGLLTPPRTASRYRSYVTADLNKLRQILALRALGLPLRRIRELLGPGAPPLQLTLRQQRHVLEERRRHLDRAIRALESAEAGLESSSGGDAALDALIEVIGMQDSIDEMRKYYSDEVWDAWRHHYESWPSEEWRALYREAESKDLKYAEEHRDIVRRFGRFPHRNTILGRATTPEEQKYLDDGGFSG